MGYILNKGQRRVVDAAVDFFRNSSDQIFQFSGNPGTGKSVVLNAIISELGLPLNKVAPMSFIGAAAIVMRLKGLTNARTIHSWLLTPVSTIATKNKDILYNDYFDRPLMGVDFVSKPLNDIELILIDEAGCVPYYLKDEIESRGIKIIACGDLDQLMPVKDKPAYLYDGNVMVLDEIMRQAENSAIIYLSQRAKHGLPIHKGFYGDVLVIDEDELTDQMIVSSDILLCGKNETRDQLNKRVRRDILGIETDIPIYGEKLICRKNNWKKEVDGISLANGLIGRVANFPDVGSFDGKTFTIDFQPDLLNSSFKGLQCDYNYFIAPHSKRQLLKNNKYSIGEKFEYAYAVTTHSAQGSQYANGIYFEEYLSKEVNSRLNFVGLTRFTNSVIYVKRKPKYY